MSNLVRNCWYMAGWSFDFPAGKPALATILGEPLVLYRKQDGSLVALEDRCPHRLAPLSAGRVEGDSLRCMYHGLLFSAEGRCTEIPGQETIPPAARVRRYPVVERGDWIWIWMGEPSLADETRIAPVKSLRDPQWVLKTGKIDYEANYELINDNLLDLTHLTYVHGSSFGADDAWSNTRPKVETIKEGVRSSRWIVNTPPIPPLGAAAHLERVDIWTTYDFVLPGVFLLYAALYPVGTSQSLKGKAPADDLPPLFATFTSQVVTPTGENTSRYFYSWGPNSQHGDEAIAQIMIDVASGAFTEDRIMIEAQQKRINLDPSRRPIPTSADRAITIFQKLMRAQDRKQAAE